MIKIPVKVQGLKCFIDNVDLKPYFESKTQKYTKIYGGKDHGKMVWKEVNEKLYKSVPKKGFWVGYGAIQWLNKHSKEINFEIEEVSPNRGAITEPLLIPDDLKNNPKFTVRGKERFYFYEALKQCFNHPLGTIKLPTGSGKTPTQLTLAHNQSKYVGLGMILVPTIIIRDQFIESAKKFGINAVDYDNFNINSPDNTVFITTHHVICSHLKDKAKKKETLEKLKKVRWVLVDEAAHATCASWFDILLKLENCERCHGFSALPVAYETEKGESFDDLDSDDARTIGILGPVLYEKSAHELSDFLNIPKLINIKYQWPEEHPLLDNKEWGDLKNSKTWHGIKKAVEINEDRLFFIINIYKHLIDNGYKVITFVSSKKYGENLLKLCNSPYIACWYGGGEAFTKDAKISVEELRKGFGNKFFGLILTSHGIEGLDFDNPLNILLLHEGKDIRRTTQMNGRIARPDNKPSIVINICDRGCYILPKHANQRSGDTIKEFGSEFVNCSTFSDFTEQLQIIE